jgi:hypothetical protein
MGPFIRNATGRPIEAKLVWGLTNINQKHLNDGERKDLEGNGGVWYDVHIIDTETERETTSFTAAYSGSIFYGPASLVTWVEGVIWHIWYDSSSRLSEQHSQSYEQHIQGQVGYVG